MLRAIALERLGRQEEALALCYEVQASQPTAENTLRMLSTAFKFLGTHGTVPARLARDLINPPSLCPQKKSRSR